MARSIPHLIEKNDLPMAVSGQRIGIMGGSFNPAHDGHANVAATALKRLRLDQLWWVVTPGNPLKAQDGLASQAERMALCAMFARHPKMRVTGFEAALSPPQSTRPHYTADTMAFLQHRYPAVRFVWVMGADNLATFHRWERWTEIAAALPIAVVDRPGWRLRALASPAARAFSAFRLAESRAATLPSTKSPRWVFLSTRLNPASSTELRAKTSQNKKK